MAVMVEEVTRDEYGDTIDFAVVRDLKIDVWFSYPTDGDKVVMEAFAPHGADLSQIPLPNDEELLKKLELLNDSFSLGYVGNNLNQLRETWLIDDYRLNVSWLVSFDRLPVYGFHPGVVYLETVNYRLLNHSVDVPCHFTEDEFWDLIMGRPHHIITNRADALDWKTLGGCDVIVASNVGDFYRTYVELEFEKN